MPRAVSNFQQIKEELKPLIESWLKAHVKDFSPERPFKCLNPAHQDEHPSMTYNGADAGEYAYTVHCFSCNWHGDIFNLIEARTGIKGFFPQVKHLCAWAGVDPAKYLSKLNIRPRKRKQRRYAAWDAQLANADREYQATGGYFQTYHVYRALEESRESQDDALYFLLDRRIATAPQARRLIQHFDLRLYRPIETFFQNLGTVPQESRPVKDTYGSLLIPLSNRCCALINAIDEVSYIGSVPPLFNLRAIHDALKAPIFRRKELYIVDNPADVLTLEAKGKHALAVLSDFGAKLLPDLLTRCGWSVRPTARTVRKAKTKDPKTIKEVIYLWFSNEHLERKTKRALYGRHIPMFLSYIDLVLSKEQQKADSELAYMLRAGAFKCNLLM